MHSLVSFIRSDRGRKMRRYIALLSAAFVVLVMSVFAVFSDQPVLAQAGVNDFRITSFDIKYKLGIDEDNRSTLSTTETIVANFENRNQNRGILREIPHSYDGHTVNLKVQSVKDSEGESVDYTVEQIGNLSVVRIGDPDTYVYGEKTYKIEYTQRDVTRSYADSTKRDEFYWDTNGTGWRVPIDSLSVSLDVDERLASSIDGEGYCYFGDEGSTDRCSLVRDGTTYSTTVEDLEAGENVTLAIGFELGTFAEFEPSFWAKYADFMIGTWIPGSIAAIGAFMFSMFRWSRLHDRKDDIGTIVNEFLPPKDVSVSAAAVLQRRHHHQYTAQLLDLAVRGYIQIIETKPKTSWISPAKHDIEIMKDSSDLLEEEREVLVDLFHEKGLAIGSKISLQETGRKTSYAKLRRDDTKNILKLMDEHYAFRNKAPGASKGLYVVALILLVVGVITLNALAGIFGLIIFVFGATLKPLTEDGVGLVRYLKGLERYMKVAEVDRINYLQSPEGVERIPRGVNPEDPDHLLKLNERLLPYAVIFGMEKKWLEELAVRYQSDDSGGPGWYSGASGYSNAAAMVGAIQGFTSGANNVNASSSPTGGSSGGGSSGGGGGGGGGGGW